MSYSFEPIHSFRAFSSLCSEVLKSLSLGSLGSILLNKSTSSLMLKAERPLMYVVMYVVVYMMESWERVFAFLSIAIATLRLVGLRGWNPR